VSAGAANPLDSLRPRQHNCTVATLIDLGPRVSKTLAKTLLKYAIGLGLLAWVISKNWNSTEAGPGLREALAGPIRLLPFAAAGLVTGVSAFLTFVRWYVLVRAVELPFTLLGAVRLGAVGCFFNTFLPGSIGGDLVKALSLARAQSRRTVAVATVLIDRAVGLWALIWLVALLGGWFWLTDNPVLREHAGLRAVVRSAWGVIVGTVVIWGLLGFLPEWRAQRFARRLSRLPKIGHNLAEFWRAIWMYRTRPRAVALALLLSLVSQSGNVLAFHFAAQTFTVAAEEDVLPSLSEHALIVPPGMAIEAVFPAPGGVGGGEFGFGKLYTLIGRPEALGVLASLARRMLQWIVGLIGYIVYLRLKPTLGVHTHPGVARSDL
jgi:glycosyltransferase 2 family protein